MRGAVARFSTGDSAASTRIGVNVFASNTSAIARPSS